MNEEKKAMIEQKTKELQKAKEMRLDEVPKLEAKLKELQEEESEEVSIVGLV